MKNLGKLRSLPSRRNEKFYHIGYSIVIALAVVVFCAWVYIILLVLRDGYDRAMDKCLENGNKREYCEVMLE